MLSAYGHCMTVAGGNAEEELLEARQRIVELEASTKTTLTGSQFLTIVLVGPLCKYTSPGDVVCFPDDKGIKVDNLRVVGHDSSLRDCLFLSEQRFFGICQDLDDDDNKPSKS